jgi:hypothetical protein
LILSLLQQLALQSLVHNRRGVGSALQHAWSILRQDPWAGGRTMTGEILLAVLALVLGGAMHLLSIGPLIALGPFAAPAVLLLKLAAFGFTCLLGVTRACYWAAAYRALGGLSPDDGVPGLEGLRGAPAES